MDAGRNGTRPGSWNGPVTLSPINVVASGANSINQAGRLVRKGPYTDGVQTGVWVEYLPNGVEWNRVTFDEGLRQTEAAQACRQRGGQWQLDFKNQILGMQRRLDC